MAGAALGRYLGTNRLVTTTILLLQLLSLISPVLSYRGDISRARLPPTQLLRGPAGVPGLATKEKNPFSPHAFSRRKKRDDSTGGGVAPKVEGKFGSITEDHCTGLGLEKCGDICVAQCCNAESALACPVNSYCTSNGEYEFCCENGHTCDEPVECLDLADRRCEGNGGELIIEDGEEKACCYTGFEVCTTIWDGFPACMPTGIVEVPPKPAIHTPTGSYDPHVAHRTSTARTNGGPTPTPTPTSQGESDDDDDENDNENDDKNDEEDDPWIDADSDGVDDDDDPTHSFPSYSGTGAIVGGVVGGLIGLAILGTCVFFTGRHYRRKRKEDQAKEKAEEETRKGNNGSGGGNGSRDGNDHARMHIRGGGIPEPASSLGSPQMFSPSPRSSSWSNHTLSGDQSQDGGVGKLAGDQQSREQSNEDGNSTDSGPRSRTMDSGVETETLTVPSPVLLVSKNHGDYMVDDAPFDWRKCLQDEEQPIFRGPPKSPRIGPICESPRSMLGSKSPRLSGSTRMELSPMPTPMMPPKSPRLEASSMPTMSGAL